LAESTDPKTPIGGLITFGVLGFLIWNCGGTFGIPFGPSYRSPAERESIRQANDAADAKKAEEQARKNDPTTYLNVGKFKWTKDEYEMVYLTATAKNISEKRLSFASIKYKLKNAKGEIVGSTSDSASNIEPGETWAIKALVADPKESLTAEISELKCSPAD
jgi:hypothetical protein